MIKPSSKFLGLGILVALCGSAAAQTWTKVNGKPNIAAYSPVLLTDGRVLIQDADNDHWWILSPNNKGSYVNGTWKEAARVSGYGPLYYACSVLPDGRVFTMGGEYNNGSGGVWQNTGYIYDPVKDSWVFMAAPPGWSNIGDMGSCTYPNGKLMIAHPLSRQCALFDPLTNTYSSIFTTGKLDGNDEEGLTLLPDGNILTVDATVSNSSEILNTVTSTWASGGATPVNLVGDGEEIGPMVLRPDGTVICFGGGGHNCVYNTKTKTWSTAPDFPSIAAGQLDCADAPACLLTNGRVLVQTSPGLFNDGSVFFEWNGTSLTQVQGSANAPFIPSFYGSFVMLPSGEALYADMFGGDLSVYTSPGGPDDSWRPTITSFPSTVKVGLSYSISGTQFNGLSQSSAYGDDEQNATNFPLIRITNTSTGHVFYCREFNPSTMAVWTGAKTVTTNFFVSGSVELGQSTLEVVTNGIPSKPVSITVEPFVQASGVSVFQGKNGKGALSTIWHQDDIFYTAQSVLTEIGQTVTVEGDFNLPAGNVSNLGVFVAAQAVKKATGMLFLYDWVAGNWVYLSSYQFNGANTIKMNASAPAGSSARFSGPGGLVKVAVRAVVPPHLNPVQFKLSVDTMQMTSS